MMMMKRGDLETLKMFKGQLGPNISFPILLIGVRVFWLTREPGALSGDIGMVISWEFFIEEYKDTLI